VTGHEWRLAGLAALMIDHSAPGQAWSERREVAPKNFEKQPGVRVPPPKVEVARAEASLACLYGVDGRP
jgi:hypothetical protein